MRTVIDRATTQKKHPTLEKDGLENPQEWPKATVTAAKGKGECLRFECGPPALHSEVTTLIPIQVSESGAPKGTSESSRALGSWEIVGAVAERAEN